MNFVFFLLLSFVTFFSFANEIVVCPTCDVKSIKSAVETASPGSTIRIQKAVYSEGPIVITKPLILKGEDLPVLDGENKNQILTILKSDGVVITGLVFKNTGVSYTQELSGLKIIESKNCMVYENTFINTTYGIYLDNSENCRLFSNYIEGSAQDEASGGNGIHAWYGGKHTIQKNKIRGHRDGIYLEFASGTKVENNDVRKNLRYGLHFMSSHNTEYLNNIFTENGAGVAVMYSRQVKMHHNNFIGNTGPAAYGLLLKEVHDSEIVLNDFSKNTVAIYMEGSNRSQFQNNLISSNGWGLRIMGDCENNNFVKNNFIANTFDITTNADHSWNVFKENYWSQYEGYDLNHDGIGDVPFRPVSLSSVILEKVDSSYVLMNSFFFKLMDQVERALPSLIPEPLKDESPLLHPVERDPTYD